MKRALFFATFPLAGCGFPYTPRALPPLSTPDAEAAAPAPSYMPPRQTEAVDDPRPAGSGPDDGNSRRSGHGVSSRPVQMR